MGKPILCMDFDGVIHSYESGWKGADVIPDPPVAGAMQFLCEASATFRVAIYSSRSGQSGGIDAMKAWMKTQLGNEPHLLGPWFLEVEWPTEKPAAFVTIDDRALTFDGTWPRVGDLRKFQPWNKRPTGATGNHPLGKLNADDEGGLRMGIASDVRNGVCMACRPWFVGVDMGASDGDRTAVKCWCGEVASWGANERRPTSCKRCAARFEFKSN